MKVMRSSATPSEQARDILGPASPWAEDTIETIQRSLREEYGLPGTREDALELLDAFRPLLELGISGAERLGRK